MKKEFVDINATQCTVHPFKRICWTAIFIGALVGLGLSFLLNLFGIAIGLSAFTVNEQGVAALAVGGLIGILIATIVSMLVAGYAAGFLGRFYCPKRNLGILYGFSTWTIALLLSAAVWGQVSVYVKEYAHNVSPSVTVTQNAKLYSDEPTNSSASSKNKKQDMTSEATSPKGLAYGAFILFGMFFIGALSSCIGACWAMACRRDD